MSDFTAMQNMPESSTDIAFMSMAISLARRAAQADEVPVGAIVVGAQGILGRGYNLREHLQTPLAHAELLAIHRACQKVGSWRLPGVTVYTTLEPCVMCAGALLQARIGRLVFGAKDTKGGGFEGLLELAKTPKLNHQFAVTSGVLAEECSQLLKDFFAYKRAKKKRIITCP